ncbi:hypothetical protein [Lentzea sp. NEAU-D7]|uniref:hypothetical protein n=1 Tax=Lentzea sp. NEAU-D7 TaxID=2994667 RepID=UPI00224B7F89|nr:hypothetical protein [Lentzea sp. NEAU-D7]MCX2953609.1 hypothetical protein [Lentzea sp. NEAU-D7]
MTDIEQRLIEAARDGEWLECAEPDTVVRAGLIRELLLGRHGELDPRGVRLSGARVEGTLNLNRIKASVGLAFHHCTIDEPIEARSASLPDLVFHGGSCAGIHADGVHVDGDLYLRQGVRISGSDTRSTVRLVGAHISGDFELSGTRITNTAGAALDCQGLRVDGQLCLRDGAQVIGHGDRGAIILQEARMGSVFEMSEVEITSTTGPAVIIDGVSISGYLALRGGSRIAGHCAKGAFSLVNAHISGHAELTDTEITNTAGIALDANGAQIDGHLFLRNRLLVTGHSEYAAVDLINARVGNILELADITITNAKGAALSANRARIGGAFALLGRTRLSACGDHPALNLVGTRIGGRFGCADEVEFEVEAESTPVLNFLDTAVDVSVRLPHPALCPDRGRGTACGHKTLVRLENLGYSSLASTWDWQEWLHVIRCHTPAYHASAYQRLAAVERAAGHDGTVRQILMAQQTDLRRRSPQSLGGPLTRWFHWLWGALAGYGYRARRTAAALLLVLVVAGAIGWSAGQVSTRPGHLVAERVVTAPVGAGTPCSTVELIGLGLDRGLPLAMTGMRARCDLDSASKKGQAFTAAIWLVQLAVWGLATLALAGYTNLVRKPG